MPASALAPGARVAVTGASGFVGSWICKSLAAAGFSVRAMVRDAQSPKNEHLAGISGIDFAEADMLAVGAYDEAFTGVDAVVHAAAIVDLMDNSEEAIVTPTVEGTRNVLHSVRQSPSVRHVIGTSSIAAITNFAMADEYTLTEKDTVDLDHPQNKLLYVKAKALEEQLLWAFHRETKVPVTTINPGMVWGPVLAKRHTKASPLYIRNAFYGNAVPPAQTMTVDVRDVADAHVLALQNARSHGERFLLINDEPRMSIAEVGGRLQKLYPQYRIATPPAFSDAVVSAFSLGLKVPGLGPLMTRATGMDASMLANVTRKPQYDNRKSKTVLGVTYRSLDETLKATGDSIVTQGFVSPRPQQ